ncbi:VacJ family lipoprotein [Zoogloea sp. 1C4]|jgi:phospholipid-binding lipoprotein MlaA|uniref:MlaA family lipoprotein n=1 Tax=Zoogloea sp. 1C4 TaxID=2570190 RepID=UPI0012925EE6|nr:VacJ family lipoprotein [Zoogloea sp. 1C4]
MKNSTPDSTPVRRGALALLLALGLSACAGTGGHPKDPLEPLNRATFSFNETADRYVMRPVAQVYDLAPLPVKVGVGNFFGNLGDFWIGVNNLLQGKFVDGLSDGGRLLINSTIGIFGIFDIATEMGLEKHDEDLGQTLGRWGVGDGPYLVLPLLGPSNLRDTVGLVGDLNVDPIWGVEDIGERNRLTALRFINRRAQLLGADTTADQAALDKYGYMRSFYIQYRRSQVYDGRPPREKDEDDDSGAE